MRAQTQLFRTSPEETKVRVVVQRVTRAAVTVGGEVVGRIGPGLCLLVGVTHSDTVPVAARMADKVWGLRIFRDEAGAMNRSAADVGAEILVVSQFTLYGDVTRGRRPSFSEAAPGSVAEPIVDALLRSLRTLGPVVATGRFGADMAVDLVNDGPVTVIVDL
jgi:D-tyrosyl-tRNA(Tyr) deacylase